MSEYIPTIGLEIHAELKTKSKMFCGCLNNPYEDKENTNICPVCMAHPGTLPVINKEAVKQVLRVGVAVGGNVADFTEFDRKNYFYPDIPKNYQISQYKYPLISGGEIEGVEITRIHLEEDTARSVHGDNSSNVDYNRAGVPLMELVTEPVIHDSETAVKFAKELRLILQYLNASDANLNKGEMRVEANISVAKNGEEMGTKVEVKNLNSFKSVGMAIEYEIKRHISMLEKDEKIVQETRGWDENKQKTFSQRIKENSHDYRYFPDPDLPKLFISEIEDFDFDSIKKSINKLPSQLREDYIKNGLKDGIVDILVENKELNDFYSNLGEHLGDDKEMHLGANYVTSDLLGLVSSQNYEGLPLSEMDSKGFAKIIKMIVSNSLSSRGAKDVLSKWVNTGEDPKKIAEELGIMQISDESALEEIVLNIVNDNMKVVEEYKSGKESVLQFLVGQGMKATKGAANPAVLKELLLLKINQ
jgi:aspartyl-tRNA(Asn)/glutamyl-tRNA(Gln) amidotransferase subunit B